MINKQNLFLDCGGLIFDYTFNQETLERAHKLALESTNKIAIGRKISLQELRDAHDKAIQWYSMVKSEDSSEMSMDSIMGIMLSYLNVELPPELWHSRALAVLYQMNDHDYRPCPNSKQVLGQLSQDYRLGIISNSPHKSLIYELVKCRMLDFFKGLIVMSCQVGVRKPHPRIYQEAMRRARTTPKNSIFASHDQEEVEGAENVGMRGLLVKSLEEVIGAL